MSLGLGWTAGLSVLSSSERLIICSPSDQMITMMIIYKNRKIQEDLTIQLTVKITELFLSNESGILAHKLNNLLEVRE